MSEMEVRQETSTQTDVGKAMMAKLAQLYILCEKQNKGILYLTSFRYRLLISTTLGQRRKARPNGIAAKNLDHTTTEIRDSKD